MEDRTDSPLAVKIEEHSQCVILTYFQGDINSMVDAHFTRALSKVCKDKVPVTKTKKIRKTVKMGKHTKITCSDLTKKQQQQRVSASHPHCVACFFVPAESSSSCQGSQC
uniref:Uncharacterized protein n=1 Tax=Mastacembelus armatus TaxID=205130 RepID=A0A7N8XG82_9TELE